jgi:hypothetical protein
MQREEMSENEKLAWHIVESNIQNEQGETPTPDEICSLSAKGIVQLICQALESKEQSNDGNTQDR